MPSTEQKRAPGSVQDRKLIQFRRPDSRAAASAACLTQETLTRERLAARKAAEALEELEAIRKQIREALLRGITIEEGPLRAYLKPRRRAAYLSRACAYLELVVE